jgi:NAD(P)-dependent dehydrogenase (short-subunit alcohol dehydrogenase family)
MATRTAYCASKAGIVHFTKALAIELGPYGITVNAIAPNVIITDLNREAIKKTPQLYDNILRRIPLGRFGEQVDIAGALVFLASPAASYITGQTIYIDGGYTAG